MADITMRIEQSVQVTAFCHQRVSIGISFAEDASDERIQSLIDGPVEKGYKHLSKAVRAKCDDMRTNALAELEDSQ